MQKLVIALLLVIQISGFCTDFMSAQDVKRGMKGEALTVFHGWQPESFDIEVIDVIDNYFSGYPMILARGISSNVIRTGVAAGMSGSPVYINGKLIGAVAYTWSFSKEPIFGITPIKAMLDLTNAIFETSQSHLEKIATPVMLSGFGGASSQFMKKFLTKKGFTIGESVSGSQESVKSHLIPGAGVAINLVDGDLVMAAIGTVTYVEGKRVWIFGHPMEKFGKVSLPISRAYIHTILPSRQLSFKMGTSSLPIGSTVYDGKTAVYCETGRNADMVPVKLDVRGNGMVRHYNFRVAAVKEYFPFLTVGAISASLENTVGIYDQKMLDLKLLITLKSEGHFFELTNSFHYAFNPVYFDQFAMMMDLSSYLGRFLNFNWQKFKIVGVGAQIEVTPNLKYAVLEQVRLNRKIYAPGDRVYATVILRSYMGSYKEEHLSLTLPINLKSGKYLIAFGNDFVIESQKNKLSPDSMRIRNGRDLLEWSAVKRDSKVLGMAFFYPINGVVLRDKKLLSFPLKYTRLLGTLNNNGKKRLFADSVVVKRELGETLYGSRSFSIQIKKNLPRKVKL